MIDQQTPRGRDGEFQRESQFARCNRRRIREIRQQFPEVSTDAQWATILAQYGVTGPEVEAAVAAELDGLRLLDFRLR